MKQERDRQRDYSDYTQIRLWFFPLSTSSSTTVFQICFTSKDPKHLECSEKGNHQLPWQNFLKLFPVCCPSEFTKGVKTRSRSMHRGLSLIENLGAVVFYVHVVGVRYINWCLFLLHTIYFKQFMSSFFLI